MDTKIFKKKSKFFCPQKVEKTTLKSCSEFLKSTFFPYCPDCPNGSNRRIPVPKLSKMWSIDYLYIELGFVPHNYWIKVGNSGHSEQEAATKTKGRPCFPTANAFRKSRSPQKQLGKSTARLLRVPWPS